MARIIEHEDWQKTSWRDFIAFYFAARGFGPLPPDTAIKGQVYAEINQGRWIVNCPNSGCGGAVCASSQAPRFLCPYCGSPENRGNWYAVIFPADKTAIEATLTARPALSDWNAPNRNWTRTETVATLEAENTARGTR